MPFGRRLRLARPVQWSSQAFLEIISARANVRLHTHSRANTPAMWPLHFVGSYLGELGPQATEAAKVPL